MGVDVDLGQEHALRFFRFSPDRILNPQWEGVPDVECAGIIVDHPRPDDGRACSLTVHFDHPFIRRAFPEKELWEVRSMHPLTLEPFVSCVSCGDVGYVRAGKWEPLRECAGRPEKRSLRH